MLTYDRQESYQRRVLVPKNRFQAPIGRVGFIYEPCIHEPRNTTSAWSLSLHVISPRDGEQLVDQWEPLPALSFMDGLPAAEEVHPYTRVRIARQRQRLVHQLVSILSSMDVPQAAQLLARGFTLASSATRRLIANKVKNSDAINASGPRWTLARTHPDLILSHRREGSMVALDVETAHGLVEELAISDEASDALAFVAKEPIFDVCALPGNLSEEEQMAIAEVLEDTGLFTRVQQ